jgi:chromosome segregation ATPase
MDTRLELADEVTRLETVLREKEAARQKRVSKANETLKEVERKREKVEKTISGLEAKREKLLIWLKDFEARSASEAETVTELRARRENLLAQLQDAEAIGAIEAEADARCEQALADLRRREGESKSLEEQVAMLRATLRDSFSSHLQIFGP